MRLTINLILATTLLTLLSPVNGQGIRTIKGIVVDKGGDPLVGCNVMIKGTLTGTVTDVCGEFSIPIGKEDLTIVFHSMSYDDLRTFETKLRVKEITDESIVFQLGKGKMRNKNCKKTIDKNLKKYRIY